jgi:hypothetical protein
MTTLQGGDSPPSVLLQWLHHEQSRPGRTPWNIKNTEECQMSTKEVFAIRSKVLPTVLVTMGWLVLVLCWMAFAWSQYSFFQNLVCLGIATLLYAATTGAMWVMDQGIMLVATILTTLGWLSFALYWIGFAWSRHTLLQNGAILMLSLLVCGGAVVVLRLAELSNQTC